MFIFAIYWQLWKRRNVKVFRDQNQTVELNLCCLLSWKRRGRTVPKSSKMIEPLKQKSCLGIFLPTLLLLFAAFYIWSNFLVADYKQGMLRSLKFDAANSGLQKDRACETHDKPNGTGSLPKGIISGTSDLEMRSLWGVQEKLKKPTNLLAVAVGIKQKDSVDKIIKKFPSRDFIVMLFHYDDNVDGWRDLEWNHQAIHVSAVNQTKWWFAKRFLQPDIVADYDYIFLWDEDLGVQHFHAGRYLSIIREEGLEISQPAVDPKTSEVHHRLTARKKGSRVHRRIQGKIGGTICDENREGPPCSGFVEMMAPVFSRVSWSCAWNMIQNDLVHSWGLDFQLGYCAQGNRTKNIGIVDSEYITHYGLPTLGGGSPSTKEQQQPSDQPTNRDSVKKRSYVELEIFKKRWKKAVKDDKYWTDPY